MSADTRDLPSGGGISHSDGDLPYTGCVQARATRRFAAIPNPQRPAELSMRCRQRGFVGKPGGRLAQGILTMLGQPNGVLDLLEAL